MSSSRVVVGLWLASMFAATAAGCLSAPHRTTAAWLESRTFDRRDVVSAGFAHTVLYRPPTSGQPVDAHSSSTFVYFEGDGQPWSASGMVPSANPDPRRPLAIELAASQQGPVFVLGRPCYFGHTLDPGCLEELWTSARYSETVVASMSTAVRRALDAYDLRSAVLVGYSGGGSLALLVAPRVPQVKAVVTVAANLDLEAWTRYHGYLPLEGSLDPLAAAPLAPGCEIHIAAERDAVVPVEQLRHALTKRPDALLWVEPGIDHACCWTGRWPGLLARIRTQLEASGCLAETD
jgi:hypothetical protein